MAPVTSSTLLVLVAAAAAYAVAGAARREAGGLTMAARHERWMAKFGRAYADADEKARRLEVFARNAQHVDAMNRAGNRTYTLGLNHFADLTDDEFVQAYLSHGLPADEGTSMPMSSSKGVALEYGYQPVSVDWRARGAVTGVKNQATCGSCWAFAAVAATEGLVKIATGNLISLSEQQVLDCTGGADTCSGGDVNRALTYIAASGGLQAEAAYPYTSQKGACRLSAAPNWAAAVGGSRWARLNGDERALQFLAARQPVAVIVDASEPDFRYYKSGVYVGSSSCGRQLNHAVTVVGYGAVAPGDERYWVVKNQWGTSWGEEGYMRIARGLPNVNCGIATSAYYPAMYN